MGIVNIEPLPDGTFSLSLPGFYMACTREQVEGIREACDAALNGAALPAVVTTNGHNEHILLCPHCEALVRTYVEGTTTWRIIKRLGRDKLWIFSDYTVADDGDDEHLLCTGCLARLLIPDGLDLEWVG